MEINHSMGCLGRKGVILAGGSGTRLYPLTLAVSKQLMPIYDKPTIYYPIGTLMQMGIKDILIITTPDDQHSFIKLLQDGLQFGINIKYATQPNPNGLAEAFIIAQECGYLGDSPCVMILGDNIFHGNDAFTKCIKTASQSDRNTIFAYHVADPSAYGCITFDTEGNAVDLEEKPKIPKSNYAVPGLYFFNNDVYYIASSLIKSSRGELEIVDVCKEYIKRGSLSVIKVPDGVAWLDSGTHPNLIDAAQYVRIIEERQGYKIACLEEIAYHNNWITKDELNRQIKKLGKSTYCEYLKKIN